MNKIALTTTIIITKRKTEIELPINNQHGNKNFGQKLKLGKVNINIGRNVKMNK